MQFPIFIELRRSPFLASLLCSVHGLAAVALLLAPLVWPLRAGLWLCLAGSLAWSLRRQPVSGLRLLGPARIELVLADGGVRPARVERGTTVFARLIVLRASIEGEREVRKEREELEGGRADAWRRWTTKCRDGRWQKQRRKYSSTIFPDQLPEDRHRQLRLWLRLQDGAAGARHSTD